MQAIGVFLLPVMVALLLVGVPIAVTLGLVGAWLLWAFGGTKTLVLVALQAYEVASSYTFIAVPLYILLGFIVQVGGIGGYIVDAVQAWVGRVRGGIGMAVAIAMAIMGY